MTLRVGVIGAGALGFHHTRILRDVPGATFAGFHESDAARAATVATELGVKAFASLDALLDDVEAVTIVVPTPAHFAVAAPALERGLHVLIEKPIAATLDEADALLAHRQAHRGGDADRARRAVQSRDPRARCRTSNRRGSSRATGSRRSIRAGRTSPSCSTS